MEKYLLSSGTVSTEFVAQSHTLGHLIYWQKHGQISIQVRQDKQLCWLMINDTLQSVIDKADATHLLLPHLQCLAHLWQDKSAPKKVLELGLGAGAIHDYLSTIYPDCHVLSVEKDPEVIRCYKKYFNGHSLSTVQCLDACDALNDSAEYDWIILDLFSEEDAPQFLFQHKFYEQLRTHLKEGGWLFINFLASHPSQLTQLENLLIKNFGKKPYCYPVPDYVNHIIAVSR